MVNWGKGERKMQLVQMPTETHRTFKAVCARRGKSMTEVLNALVLDYIAQAQAEDRAAFLAAKEADNV